MAVVPLKFPKDINGQHYEALTLRRADGGALRLLDRHGAIGLIAEAESRRKAGAEGVAILPAGLIDRMAPFFARVAGVDEAVIDALDAEDFMSLFDKIDEVMPASPLSGKTSTTG